MIERPAALPSLPRVSIRARMQTLRRVIDPGGEKGQRDILRTDMIRYSIAVLTFSLVVATANAEPAEALPPGAKIVKLEAHPQQLELKTPFEYSQLVLTAHLAGGEQIDVTRLAKIEAPAQLVRINATGVVRPVADGNGALKISLQDQTLTLPIVVKGQKENYKVSFVRDVMPTLSRMGCNAGTCHGAAKGRNGFKLSLRGYDPLFDHRSLTDDLKGRRFNRAAPDASLMLLKCTGTVAHVGGVLTQPAEPYYELLRSWIADGVKLDLNSPRVQSLEVLPKSSVVPLPGMKQQIAVRATFTDGSVRDVSVEAFLESSNTDVATVNRAGTVTAVRRGETTILARYEGAYAAAGIVIMGDRKGYQWRDVPEYTYIDKLVDAKLKQMKILPSELCTDAEFLRRIYLDLIGLPPEPSEIRAFLTDSRPTRVKRDALVDKLVGSPEFIEHWTNKWADLLQVNRKFLGEEGAKRFREYIRLSIADNKPYDRFVYEILTAHGSTLEEPAACYYKVLREPDAVMENTTQLFLAVRFNCNKCHDHPFERWTQDQYYQTAAFFAQVQRKEDPKFKGQRVGGSAVEGATPLVEIIQDAKAGEVAHLRTGQIAKPTFPYLHRDLAPPSAGRREQFAHWVTSKDNPYFAKSYVNRLWSYLLGVGIIEPIDDIRAGNPPTNPALLDALTDDFIKNGFNVRHMLRTICKSRAYQQSVQTNAFNRDDDINYSHALVRRLPAEVLYDAIHRATGSLSRLPGLPAGARAAQLLDSRDDVPGGFFVLFGKPARESACECERSPTMMLGSVLNLVNGPVPAAAINDPNNRLVKLVATEKDDAKVVEELFLAFLGRLPTPTEMQLGLQTLQDGAKTYESQIAEAKQHHAALAAYEKTLDVRQGQWEEQVKHTIPPTWTPLDVVKADSKGGAILSKQSDGSLLVSGKNPAKDSYTITASPTLPSPPGGEGRVGRITALRLEVLPDKSLPAKGPGRAPNGNFVLNELKLSFTAPGEKSARFIALKNAQADFAQDGSAPAGAIDNDPATGWAVAPELGKPHTAIFELATPLNLPSDATLTVTMAQSLGYQHTLGRFRLSMTTDKTLSLKGPPQAIVKILGIEPAKRTPQQKIELTNYYRSVDTELSRLRQLAAEHPMPVDKRLPGAQDLAWAFINAKAFQFNH
jgi:uncharacterized protein DUF1549/uncharacterized protein DUF1553/Big-like domain-containing protein